MAKEWLGVFPVFFLVFQGGGEFDQPLTGARYDLMPNNHTSYLMTRKQDRERAERPLRSAEGIGCAFDGGKNYKTNLGYPFYDRALSCYTVAIKGNVRGS